MAQQFLDRPQVGAGAQQMGRETVAQGVGGGAFRQAQPAAQPLDRGLDVARAERTAAPGAEQGVGRLKRKGLKRQIGVHRRADGGQDRDDPGL